MGDTAEGVLGVYGSSGARLSNNTWARLPSVLGASIPLHGTSTGGSTDSLHPKPYALRPTSSSLLRTTILIVLFSLAVSRADERMVENARSFEIHGVRLGMSQGELVEVLPKVRVDRDAVTGITGAVSPELGQERWVVGEIPDGAREGHFEFLDSVLYSMSWNYDGDRAAFKRMQASFVEQLGTAHVIQSNALTWLYAVAQRRIELVLEPIVGISVVVVDTEAVRRILERSVGEAGG